MDVSERKRAGATGLGPPQAIRRKLLMLAFPAAMVLAVGVVLLAIHYSTPSSARTDGLYYSAVLLTFLPLFVLFPVVKVLVLWPAPKKKG